MGTIYQKTISGGTEQDLVLQPGEAFSRPMVLPSTWTEVRLGMFISFTTLDSLNAAPADETVVFNNYLSMFMFGIKDTSAIAPGFPGSQFIGGIPARGYPSALLAGASNKWFTGVGATDYVSPITCNGSSVVSGGPVAPPTGALFMPSPSAMASASGFAGFISLACVVSGSTFVLRIASASSGFTDVTLTNLQNLILSSSYDTSSPINGWWTSGQTPGVANWYFRSPLQTARARIHCVGYRVIS